MSAPSPLVVALIDALASDPDALDQLAAALAPRLTAVVSATADSGSLTTTEAARRASLHERTIRRALAAGTLEGYTVAGRWRIEPHTLDDWLRVGAPTSATPTHSNGRARHGTSAGADAIAGRRAA